MTIPSRWRPFVLDVATRPGPLQARAEQLVQEHQAARGRRLARSLPRRKTAAAERGARTGARRALREAAVTRAGGRCEACGVDVPEKLLELDHIFGRGRSEHIETVWMLCRSCHREKTNNSPSHMAWLERAFEWAGRRGFGRTRLLAGRAMELEKGQLGAAGPGKARLGSAWLGEAGQGAVSTNIKDGTT